MAENMDADSKIKAMDAVIDLIGREVEGALGQGVGATSWHKEEVFDVLATAIQAPLQEETQRLRKELHETRHLLALMAELVFVHGEVSGQLTSAEAQSRLEEIRGLLPQFVGNVSASSGRRAEGENA